MYLLTFGRCQAFIYYDHGKHLLVGTLDGRNPAPVDTENILFFIGFHTSWVQDFFHQ